MMPGSPTSVIVVGAGPAGATLGYLLASRGVSVTLLERHRDFTREFRGEVLLPSGLEALHDMGLGDVVPSIPHIAPTAIALYANARPVFRLPVHPAFVGPHPPTALSQPAFLEAVIRAASAYSSFRVELGVTVTDLLRVDGRVGGVMVRSQTGERELRADLVVGADGRSSAIRRGCGLEVRKHGLDVDVVWCKVPLPAHRKKVIYTELRRYLGDVLRRLAQRRESEVEEGHGGFNLSMQQSRPVYQQA